MEYQVFQEGSPIPPNSPPQAKRKASEEGEMEMEPVKHIRRDGKLSYEYDEGEDAHLSQLGEISLDVPSEYISK
jgi:hypothetical protein